MLRPPRAAPPASRLLPPASRLSAAGCTRHTYYTCYDGLHASMPAASSSAAGCALSFESLTRENEETFYHCDQAGCPGAMPRYL